MKYLLAILVSLIASYSFCQSNSIDLITGVGYTYRNLRLETGDDDLFNQFAKKKYEVLNRLATPKINFRAGFNLNFPVKDYKEIKIGIRYAQVGYYTGLENLQSGDSMFQYTDDTGTSNTSFISYGGRFNDIVRLRIYKMIEIPILLKYYITKGKFSSFAEIGISPSLNISTKHVYTSFRTLTFQGDMNRLQLDLIISSGFNYSINHKHALFLQPIFRYQINKTENLGTKEHLFHIGLELGVKNYFIKNTTS